MLSALIQFTLEILRALLVDALSARVRRNIELLFRRGPTGRFDIHLVAHRRNRHRLMNRLYTENPSES